MITQRAVQQALAQAAVGLPFKRKDRHTHDDDASTLTSVQEAGTNKRMFFPTIKAPDNRNRKVLGPPTLRNARGGERFDQAALLGCRMPQSDLRANPAKKSSLPAASYAEKEWMAVTAGVNMRMSVQENFLPVTKSSSFLTKELLPQAANMLQQFRGKFERNMNEPRPRVHSDVLCIMVTNKKPFINGAFVGLFINNIWSPLYFASSRCDLSESMNLFLWCPADQQSQQYAKEEGDVVTEQNDAPMSQGKAKIGRSVPVLAKCTEARDVISALLWMAAAVVTITREVKNYAPAFGLLCDMAANMVHTRAMRTILSDEAERKELLCHLLLHELQKLFSDYIRESVNHNHKRTADTEGYVRVKLFNKAVLVICDLQKRMQDYKISDVSGQNLARLKK